MKISLPPALFLALFLPSGAVVAQTADCLAPQTQLEMSQCARQSYDEADRALNHAYGLARVRLRDLDAQLLEADRGGEAHLRQAQLSWISFRDSACVAEGYPYFGGSIAPMVILDCMTRLTRQRSADLQALAAGQ